MDHDYCSEPPASSAADVAEYTGVEYLIEEYEHVKPHLPAPANETVVDTDVKGTGENARRCDCAQKRARMERETKRLRRMVALERQRCRMLKARLRKLREELRVLRAIRKRQEARNVALLKRTIRKILYFGNYAF